MRIPNILDGRADLRRLGSRPFGVIVVAALIGAATGLFVAGIDWLFVDVIYDHLFGLPLWVLAVLPGIGLALSWVILQTVGGGCSSATADEFLIAFHDRDHALAVRPFVARMLATVATIGSGNPLGLEGPSMYAGATFGAAVQRRTGIDRRTLVAVGAAAGVAAIFKTPATGIVFALEVPYRDDLARRILLPVSVSAASGYLVFVAINGTAPLFTITGAPDFSFAELAVAIALGVVAGLAARAFTRLIRFAKASQRRPAAVRLPVAAALMGALFVVARLTTGENLTLGSGYTVITWALDPERTVGVLLVVFLARCAATAVAVGGSGVGGLFIPLVVGGALIGRMAGEISNVGDVTFLTVIGTAAFLGAGYRVPLAAVVFVAESTGRSGFIVPGLLAAVAAELVMGDASMTAYQLDSSASEDSGDGPLPA